MLPSSNVIRTSSRPGDRVENRGARLSRHPDVGLARRKRTWRLADAMEREVDRSPLHHRINGTGAGGLARHENSAEFARPQKKTRRLGVAWIERKSMVRMPL